MIKRFAEAMILFGLDQENIPMGKRSLGKRIIVCVK